MLQHSGICSRLRLALELCRQSILEKFGGSVLGSAWLFVWPLAQLSIYLVIFGQLMGGRLGMANHLSSYGVYLASGLLTWTCFGATLMQTTGVFARKRALIAKSPVNMGIFPLAASIEEMLPFLAGFVLLLVFDLWLGWRPDAVRLGLCLFAFYCQQMLAAGLGLFLACCAVFSKDVIEMAGVALQMAFWFTPIVYLPMILPHWLADYLWLNPMTTVVELFHGFFVADFSPDISFMRLVYLFVFSHAGFLLGWLTLGRWQKDIRDAL